MTSSTFCKNSWQHWLTCPSPALEINSTMYVFSEQSPVYDFWCRYNTS